MFAKSFHDARGTVESPSLTEKGKTYSPQETSDYVIINEKHLYTFFKFGKKAKQNSDEAYVSIDTICNLVIDGHVYQTVQHFFQSQKFKEHDRKQFTGLKPKIKTAKQAKSAGSRGAMRKIFGYTISDLKWKGPSNDNDEDYRNIRAMKKALWARWEQDKRFRDILQVPGRLFRYMETPRSSSSSDKILEWGCFCNKGTWNGLNILGNLMNELACFHDVPQYFECSVGHQNVLNWCGQTPLNDTLHYFSYPRNTYGILREQSTFETPYNSCGYKVRDCDAVHPFLKQSHIMTNPSILLHA